MRTKANAIASKQTPAGPKPPAGRVLCAEGSKVIGPVLRMFLESAGYEVTLVRDGEQAWELLSSKEVDLLITAQRMSGMTGLDLILRARAAGLTLPAILMVGSHEVLPRDPLVELNVSGVLVKPFSQQQLLVAVRKSRPRKPGAGRHSKSEV